MSNVNSVTTTTTTTAPEPATEVIGVAHPTPTAPKHAKQPAQRASNVIPYVDDEPSEYYQDATLHPIMNALEFSFIKRPLLLVIVAFNLFYMFAGLPNIYGEALMLFGITYTAVCFGMKLNENKTQRENAIRKDIEAEMIDLRLDGWSGVCEGRKVFHMRGNNQPAKRVGPHREQRIHRLEALGFNINSLDPSTARKGLPYFERMLREEPFLTR